MKNCGVFFIVLALVCFVVCGIFASNAHDKYTNYYNSDTYASLNKNAYVGGDAYNYIINGTYFTAFAVSAVGCGIGGALLLVGGAILIGVSTVRKHSERLINSIANRE